MHFDRFRKAVLCLAPLVALTPVSTSFAEDFGITLYVDVNYRGAYQTFTGDVARLDDTAFRQDRASSLRISPGCTAILYADHDFRGRSMRVDRDVPSLVRSPIGNDTLSSIEVRCFRDGDIDWDSRRGVALYSDAHFEGRREIFTRDDNNLRNNRIGNDKATSVRVSPGCEATLYSDVDYRGRYVVITYDTEGLGETAVGNDTVSSLRVDCDRRQRGRERYDRPRRDRRTPPNSVTLYSDAEFEGRSETFYRDVPHLGDTLIGNDTLSSLRVGRACRVILFEHSDFRGRSTELDGAVPNMRATALGNDRASSMRLDCGRGGYGNPPPRSNRGLITLYSGSNYGGQSESFDRSVRNLRTTRIGNDTVRSVEVAPGCRVTLYRDSEFRGRSAVLLTDTPNLQFTSVGNGQASSLEVDCRRR
ncbi:MAG: beta/gamma crystallin-related protein [Acidobacteriota bacterium]